MSSPGHDQGGGSEHQQACAQPPGPAAPEQLRESAGQAVQEEVGGDDRGGDRHHVGPRGHARVEQARAYTDARPFELQLRQLEQVAHDLPQLAQHADERVLGAPVLGRRFFRDFALRFAHRPRRPLSVASAGTRAVRPRRARWPASEPASRGRRS